MVTSSIILLSSKRRPSASSFFNSKVFSVCVPVGFSSCNLILLLSSHVSPGLLSFLFNSTKRHQKDKLMSWAIHIYLR